MCYRDAGRYGSQNGSVCVLLHAHIASARVAYRAMELDADAPDSARLDSLSARQVPEQVLVMNS